MFHKFYKDIDELHEAVKPIRGMSPYWRQKTMHEAFENLHASAQYIALQSRIVIDGFLSVFSDVVKK